MIEVGEKRYLIMVIISFVIYGCVDNNYDLKKDISLDVEIGGDAFVFPIGTTEKLLLKEIMDISDPLEIDNDSNYYIKKNGDIEDFEIEIDPFEIDMDDPEFDSRTVSIDRYYDSDLDYIFRFDEDRFGYLPISEQDKIKQQLELDKEDAKKCEVNLSGEFNFVETINLSQTDLPKDVLSLVSIKPEIGATVSIILKVDPSDIIAVDVEYLNFKDVKVKFPKFIKFKETDENNVLIINEYYKPTLNNRNFKKQLVIESIDFSVLNAKHLPVNDGHILLETENNINIDGRIELLSYAGMLNINDVTIIPEVVINPFNVLEFEGRINPEIEQQHEEVSIDLSDDLDFLKKDAVLFFSNPMIKIMLEHNLGTPMNISAEMIALDKDDNPLNSVIITDLMLDKVTDLTQLTPQEFILCKYENDHKDTVKVEDFDNLFQVIPEKVKMHIDVKSDLYSKDHHKVDLTRKNYIKGYYEMNMPVAFDSLKINYTESIEDLQSDLGDVKIISTATAHLDLTAISTLPLSLNIAGKAYDIDGNLIEGISITTDQIILAGNQDGTEKETLIRLSLKFEKNTFNLLDRIDLNVNGEIKQNERSKQLNARQYLKFVNMRFKLDGKATIDFN